MLRALYASHIRDSIETGHAERIGHGLDIAYERDAPAPLRELSRRHMRMVRDCLEHAFLPGASLWPAPEQFSPAPACKGELMDGPPKAASCRHFLARSERAALPWREDVELNRFEATL
jgi:adenosine deaminase